MSSVPNSPCHKSPKRKEVKNTFASNLRPQNILEDSDSNNNNSHFTPYPMIPPVRSAPGLYWKFAEKLSHVDDTKREVPRINIGNEFQADFLPCVEVQGDKIKVEEEVEVKMEIVEENEEKELENMEYNFEQKVWDPQVMETCTDKEGINTYKS